MQDEPRTALSSLKKQVVEVHCQQEITTRRRDFDQKSRGSMESEGASNGSERGKMRVRGVRLGYVSRKARKCQ